MCSWARIYDTFSLNILEFTVKIFKFINIVSDLIYCNLY